MAVTTLTKSVDVLIGLSEQAKKTIDDINQKCLQQGLPPAFDMEDGVPKGNKDYRFEGFGFVVGFPPRLSFWVHYKPESAEHFPLGRFLMLLEH